MKERKLTESLIRYTAMMLVAVCIIAAGVSVAAAGNMIYFGGMCTENNATGNTDVLVVWGELEGDIPERITGFNIYRRPYAANDFSTAGATLLAAVTSVEGETAAINALFNEPGEEFQKAEVKAMLETITGETITDSNFALKLSGVLGSSQFKKFLLSRYSRDIARVLGRAYIDRNPGAGEFTYFIRGILDGGGESKPLGMTTVNTSVATVLPLPENFRQVKTAACSELNKGMDHERIHFNWRLPDAPEMMGLSTMIYGYDLYRSETGDALDLRAGIPAHLTKVNPQPIVIAGNTAEEGSEGYDPADAYLAYDDGDIHDNGDGLNGGDRLYYYLVARDLAGGYSATAGPLEVTVPDTKAPVMPWNVHAQRRQIDTGGTITPSMELVWDQINSLNYIKNYGRDRTVCSGTNKEICLVENPKTCGDNRPFCVDIDVQKYLVYRFESFEQASSWGTDSDGDLWPDDIDSAPCDPAVPGGLPSQIVAQIDQGDPTATGTLDTGKTIMRWVDATPTPNNKVHWYRVSGLDAAGNQSPLSPPQRAALWDRTQPEVDAVMRIERCQYTVDYLTKYDQGCDLVPDTAITLRDDTGLAKWFELYEVCSPGPSQTERMIFRGQFSEKAASVTFDDLAGYVRSCSDYLVRVFSSDIQLLGQSDTFEDAGQLREFIGCITVDRTCTDVEYTPEDVLIPFVVPGEPFDICATLQPGESARIFRKTGGKMTPLKTISNNTDGVEKICAPVDITGIVSTTACMGVRVMSPNGVGSKITYFHCIPVLAGPPEAPIMERVEKSGTEADPTFTVTWSSQSEGVAAFTVEKTSEPTGSAYETFWDLVPDPATGQFSTTIKIDPATIDVNYCFKVRAMDKILQLSDWSAEKCRVWNTPSETDSLKWPAVPEMDDAGSVTVFVVDEKVPVIDLSGDLQQRLIDYKPVCGADDKSYIIPDCAEPETCFTDAIFNCDMCGIVRSWNRFGKFVVYRQEENRPFVQVSPLVESVHCFSVTNITRRLQDPMVFMQIYGTGSVLAVSEGTVGEIEETTRLVFADWYPHKSGSKVRYKVVSFGAVSGEPEREYTSDWMTLP